MRRILSTLLVITIALGIAACGGDDDDTSEATTTSGGGTETTGSPDSGGDNAVAITISNNAFDPVDATATAGTVHFEVVNEDTTAHTFTIAGADVDIEIGPGATEAEDSELAAGDYEFACRIHPSMTGTLTVA